MYAMIPVGRVAYLVLMRTEALVCTSTTLTNIYFFRGQSSYNLSIRLFDELNLLLRVTSTLLFYNEALYALLMARLL